MLAPVSVLPVAELVVNAEVLRTFAASVIAPPDVSEIVLLVVMLLAIDKVGVLLAVNALRLVLPPIAPFRLIAPAPDVKVSELVPVALLFVVPMLIAPPLESRLVLPVTVVVPNASAVSVVLMVASTLVVLAVLVKPPVKVKLLPPLPSETPFVFRKLTALVTVLVAPFITTAYGCANVVKLPKVTLPLKVTVPVELAVLFCKVKLFDAPLTAAKLIAPLLLLTAKSAPRVAVPL